ncbi:MAG TPA: RNA polymerase sigma factor FliA [Gammaproteobacteria bacterium]|nr:RNA polymerase sigma factor FliA [Gammaproteobacteria bacterium]
MNGLAAYDDAKQISKQTDSDIVAKHAPLVKRIAYHLISRLPPSVLPDDLIQAGMIGLLEAARNYDASQGASFETYAGIRIRGAMLDEIRRSDWAPRSVHKKARVIAEAVRNIENSTGRDARDHEVAASLNMPLDEYHRLLQAASGYRVMSFEDIGPGEDSFSDQLTDEKGSPLDGLQKEDFRDSLSEAISSLPERERLVMALYYNEELNLREIGEVLGVSESRVCQIHSQAVIRLQARMSQWNLL